MYVPPASYLDVMQFYICRTNDANIRFTGTIDGFGFEKLGYTGLPKSNASRLDRYFVGTGIADLSQPPSVLLQFDQLPSGVSNGYGTMSFIIPNNSTYGSKILYQNHQKHSC